MSRHISLFLCTTRNAYGRDLVKWTPDENDESLEMIDMNMGGGSGWDQFAANRQVRIIFATYILDF